MKKVKDFISDHPVLIYYITTLVISWGGLVILLGGPNRVSSKPTNAPFLPLYLITVAGPIVAGVLLTGIYHGKKGYRDLLSRLCKWRVKAKWYAIAFFIAPITVFGTLFILSMFSSVFMPAIFSSGNNPAAIMFGLPENDVTSLLLFVLVLGLFNGLVEELGWTGFATPELKPDRSLLLSGFNLGFMWGLWHLLSNYIGIAPDAGTAPLPLYMVVILFSFLPPFRVLMVWVYKKTGSLLIAILMHASLDIFWILSMPEVLTGQQRMIWYLVWAIILWGVVAIINRKKLNLYSKHSNSI